MRRLLAALVLPLTALAVTPAAAATPVVPVARAHNGYEHARPLLVAHDLDQVQPGRTRTPNLLIDVKSDETPTYRAIDAALSRHAGILTTLTTSGVRGGAVTATISGNRDPAGGAPATLIPLISDNWTTTFTWQGVGPMPEAEREKLHTIVATAHADGRRVRFWATPDDPGAALDAVWWEELAAGVDMLNTDHLADLAGFLRDNDPRSSTPDVAWWPPRGRS